MYHVETGEEYVSKIHTDLSFLKKYLPEAKFETIRGTPGGIRTPWNGRYIIQVGAIKNAKYTNDYDKYKALGVFMIAEKADGHFALAHWTFLKDT